MSTVVLRLTPYERALLRGARSLFGVSPCAWYLLADLERRIVPRIHPQAFNVRVVVPSTATRQ